MVSPTPAGSSPSSNQKHSKKSQIPEDQSGNASLEISEGDAVQDQERHASTIRRIQGLPPSVGFVLMGAGVVGVIIPGPIGAPLFIAGGLVLAPKVFSKVDAFVKRRFPNVHQQGIQAVDRFLSDFENRFTDTKR